MKAAVALAVAIIFGGLGDILLSTGMKARGEVKIGSARDVPGIVRTIFTQPFVLLGVTSMTVYFVAYIMALAWVDVSIANPLTALSYVIATLYAVFVMREHVSSMRWAGTFFIILGAVFIGLSSR